VHACEQSMALEEKGEPSIMSQSMALEEKGEPSIMSHSHVPFLVILGNLFHLFQQ